MYELGPETEALLSAIMTCAEKVETQADGAAALDWAHAACDLADAARIIFGR